MRRARRTMFSWEYARPSEATSALRTLLTIRPTWHVEMAYCGEKAFEVDGIGSAPEDVGRRLRGGKTARFFTSDSNVAWLCAYAPLCYAVDIVEPIRKGIRMDISDADLMSVVGEANVLASCPQLLVASEILGVPGVSAAPFGF